MKHNEYIVPIGEEAKEFDEMFIGVIRRQPQLIRCYECRYFELNHFENFYSPTEKGEAEIVPIITAHKICRRWGNGCRTSEKGYCFMAERKEECSR